MKHLYIFITTLFLGCSLSLQAQNFGSRGKDFWLTFGENMSLTRAEITFQVRIACDSVDATGIIYLTALDYAIDFSVPAGEVYTYTFTSYEKTGLYNTNPGTINNYSIRVTTDNPVQVYAINRAPSASADATNVMPVHALGTDYYHISYIPIKEPGMPPLGIPDADKRDAYAVIATQNNTQVRHNNTLVATLNMGQVYYRGSATDMTGAHITTNKPVAFFAMNRCVRIPKEECCTDHLFQQLAPVNTWGKEFFVPISHLVTDRIRIVASEDGTTLTQTGASLIPNTGGQITYNLKAGQFVELEMSLRNSTGCHIKANKPVGVCAYLMGAYYVQQNNVSDPGQAWVPPIDQNVKSALIAPFNSFTSQHYALIVTPTTTRDSTRVKIGSGAKQPLSGGTWYTNPSSRMSYYSVRLYDTVASYFFTNPVGLTVMGYGVRRAESYYYLASSAMRTIDAFFYINGIHFQEFSEVICEQPVLFRAQIVGVMSKEVGHLKWYIDDVEEENVRDSLNWKKSFANGTYQIKMEVLMDNGIVKERTANITIDGAMLDSLKNIAVCVGDTVTPISFSGDKVATVSWNATNGTTIGLPANSGTENIQGFTSKNTTQNPIKATITATPKTATGCTGKSETFTITVNPLPVLAPIEGPFFFCVNDTVPSRSFSGTNVDKENVIWDAPNGNEIGMPANSGTGIIPSFITKNANEEEEPLSAIITVTPQSAAGCKGEVKTFTITVFYQKDLESIDLGRDTSICWIDSLRLNGTHPEANSYQWQDGWKGAIYTVFKGKEGDYWVTVKGPCNSSASDTINISYLNDTIMTVNWNMDTTFFCKGKVISLSFNVDAPSDAKYMWQDLSKSPVFTDLIEETGIYNYSVTVSVPCKKTMDSIKIEIMDCRPPEPKIPNIFTPNNDNINDTFGPEFTVVENVKDFQMYIYDRWGRLVFHTDNPLMQWDGNTKNGSPYAEGVYYYVITLKGPLNEEYTYHGSVTMKR